MSRFPSLFPLKTGRALRAAPLVLAVALSGCGGFRGGGGATTGSGGFFSDLTGGWQRSAPTDVAVGRNAVRIGGPEGYCVDPASTQDSGGTAFVLLGSCAAISGSSRAPQPDVPAVLTAYVGDNPTDPVSFRLAQLDQFLRSREGGAAMSRTGDATTVTVLESFAQEDTLFVRVRDTSPPDRPGLSSEYWRAVMDARGALVTLLVVGNNNAPLSPQTGLDTIQAYAEKVRVLNGEGPATLAAAPAPQQQYEVPPQQQYQEQQTYQAAPAPVAAPVPSPLSLSPLGGVGIFRRLLG